MPRKQPPPGYLTSTGAAKRLECSTSMVYNYERSGQLHRKFPPGRKQGFFLESEVAALASGMANFFDATDNFEDTDSENIIFAQATSDDMEGAFKVAASLFGDTTSAEARKPLIKRCPEGNYVVKQVKIDDNGKIIREKVVAYIHLQPLKHDRLMAFMRGEIRGKHITENDLECFEDGKTVEVLLKSIGAVKNIGQSETAQRINQLRYLRKLIRGTAIEMAKLGERGIVISKIYATSETVTGIAMAFNAKMDMFGKPLSTGRFRFVLDIETSSLPILRPYKQALEHWRTNQEDSKTN